MPSTVAPSWVPLIFHEAAEADFNNQFDLGDPWVRRGYLWATDRRIIVRRFVTPAERASLPGRWIDETRKTPNVAKTWEECIMCNDLSPSDRVEVPDVPKPRDCACLGLDPECRRCAGTGEFRSGATIRLGGGRLGRPTVAIQERYARMLRRNGVTHVILGNTNRSAVYFKVGETDEGCAAEGFLQPVLESPVPGRPAYTLDGGVERPS